MRFDGVQPVYDAWVGAVSTTGATIRARCEAATLAIQYSTSPDLSNAIVMHRNQGDGGIFTFTLSGLAPNTRYYFGFSHSPMRGQFQTFTTGIASFTIAAGSCAGNSGAEYPGRQPETSNSIAFERIRERMPLFFVHMGDLHYRNPDTTDEDEYRRHYTDVLDQPRFSALVRNVPTIYQWDDHDFGPNDSDGTYAGKAAAQAVYTERVPHWWLPSSDGAIYTTFTNGRVRFVILDPRSGRSPNADPDTSSKTRLGAEQKQWLKDTLSAATEPCIVLFVSSWWGDTTGFPDGWESFGTERAELAEWFVDNGVADRLFLVGGDIHEIMFDDGTNTQFDSGSVDPGPPYAGFGPLDASFNDFSATAQEKYQTSHQQYGTIEFVDDGLQITVTARGWACDPSADTEVSSLEKVYAV